jgi:tRNA(Ile)-lysidine synthase
LTDYQQIISNIEAKISDFIQSRNLFLPDDKILLGISGGSDSVALFYFLKRNNYNFAIAHCNFQLRGNNSEKDEEFVSELAQKNNVPFHIKKIETKKIQETSKGSIQMIARDLRYDYFQNLAKEHNYQFIAVGSNLNDQLETVILNLTKGTGLKGLHGIDAKRENIVRPLLEITKTEIKEYLAALGANHREDLSNQENKYQRNLIRNKIIPELENINPSLLPTFKSTLSNLNQDLKATEFAVKESLKVCSSINEPYEVHLNICKLKSFDFYQKIIWSVAENFGFTSAQINDIVNIIESQSGKVASSNNAVCLKNRDELIFSFTSKTSQEITLIPNFPFSNKIFFIEKIESDQTSFPNSNHEEIIDVKNLFFPLKLRIWKEGDKIIPLGMKGSKKVSDILIDTKTSMLEKQNQYVLENGNGKLIWVIGKKISDEFKITKLTQTKVKLGFNPLP